MRKSHLLLLLILTACSNTKTGTINNQVIASDQHRPQVHFSPVSGWMNDPNGMVYYKNEYHLFYQYYPDSTVWGPMHWGHATTTDLVHWKHLPVALYPDSLGMIFSGSAVVDSNNTAGFGRAGDHPLVAIFTSHNMAGEKAGKNDFQNQSIAYSNDAGKTWTKYSGNPVLKNPGIRDFRDPKVCWFEAGKKWVMTLATQDCVSFYSSKDLKNWSKESEFGKTVGSHGGVWECPDLFQLTSDGKKYWVLLVNINPGGPNGGSATQYFVGDFDGKTFTAADTKTRWVDYGPDEYAGVTWSNTGNKKIFIGWMSNWQYANQVPTVRWRSASTVPRELQLLNVNNEMLLASVPVANFRQPEENTFHLDNINAGNFDLTGKTGILGGPARIDIKTDRLDDFSLSLANQKGERLLVGFDKGSNRYFIDRTASGKTGFSNVFAARHYAPRFVNTAGTDITLVIDNASLELFADNGLSVMTAIFFPNENYTNISLQSPVSMPVSSLDFTRLKSIY